MFGWLETLLDLLLLNLRIPEMLRMLLKHWMDLESAMLVYGWRCQLAAPSVTGTPLPHGEEGLGRGVPGGTAAPAPGLLGGPGHVLPGTPSEAPLATTITAAAATVQFLGADRGPDPKLRCFNLRIITNSSSVLDCGGQ